MIRFARPLAVAAAAAAGLTAACTAGGASTLDAGPSSDGVQLVSPSNGDEITGTVSVSIATGTVDTTGATQPVDAGGHFHLLVDVDCVDNGELIPVGQAGHYQFVDGETELDVELAPGAHDLCVQFGNAENQAYYSIDSATIRVVE
jgi:hypothetical protein